MIEEIKPSALLLKFFPFAPTSGQLAFFELMDDFLTNDERERDCFLLKGYAGTGKTTIIGALIKTTKQFGYKTVLLAPTGRAAKVMSNYSKKMAVTIHKKIYRQIADAYTGNLVFERQRNLNEFTLYVVDEASMIGDDADFGSRGLLNDLVAYVYEGVGNKLVLVGDTAQLPPIGKVISPALDAGYLVANFNLSVMEQELVEVMRQGQQSGILYNATGLRNVLIDSRFDAPNEGSVKWSAVDVQKEVMPKKPTDLSIKLTTKGFKDIYKMTGERLEDGLRYAYGKYGRENVIVVTRSNKTAVNYNKYIRQTINFAEEELDASDLLMIVRNNYTVLDDDAPAGFLANGDFVEVLKIRNQEEMHGLRFATVTLRLVDFDNQPQFDAKIILDTLHTATPALSAEQNKLLYESVFQDYVHLKSKKDRADAIRKDPYMNALQVKYAYALTCHKSQGGQWGAVFVDQGYLPAEQINQDFLRWLYTGITRATEEVFLMNFNADFFE